MLEIRGLRHDYAGRTVLSVPSWDVAKGEASLVLGPVRQRQEHAPRRDRRPRHAHRRLDARRGPGSHGPRARRARRLPRPPRRPRAADPAPHRRGHRCARTCASRSAWRAARSTTRASTSVLASLGIARLGGAPGGRHLRGRGAARGHRARGREPPLADPRRRAHLGPRRRQLRARRSPCSSTRPPPAAPRSSWPRTTTASATASRGRLEL